MRSSIRLTGLGTGFCVAAVVTLVAAAAAEVPALLYVTSLLLGLVLAAVAVVVLTPVRLEAQRQVDPELLTAREPGHVAVTVRARGRTWLTGAEWDETVPSGMSGSVAGTRLRVTPRAPARLAYEVTARRRGRYAVGPLRLSIRDPFDLARRAVEVGGTSEVVVLPQRVDLAAEVDAPRPADGDRGMALHRLGHGEDDVIARPYADGDAMKRLHWKATARRGALMVRQEERPDDTRALVLLDVGWDSHGLDGPQARAGRSDSLEWAVVAAASVVAELRRTRTVVDLRTSDGTIDRRVGADVADLTVALVDLASVQAGGTGVLEAGDAPRGTVVLLGSLDVDAARRWVAAVRRPAAAFVGAATQRAARDVLDAAGWTWVTYRPGDPLAPAWAALQEATGRGHA